MLIKQWLEEFSEKKAGRITEVDWRKLVRLTRYDYGWKGNVRELRNLMERAVALNPLGKLDTD